MINILQIKEKQHNGRNYCLFGNIFKSLLVIAILIASFAPADAAKTKPYNIKLKANTSLKQLSDLCSIENRMKDGTFIIYANDKQLNGILPLIESYQERKIKQPQANHNGSFAPGFHGIIQQISYVHTLPWLHESYAG